MRRAVDVARRRAQRIVGRCEGVTELLAPPSAPVEKTIPVDELWRMAMRDAAELEPRLDVDTPRSGGRVVRVDARMARMGLRHLLWHAVLLAGRRRLTVTHGDGVDGFASWVDFPADAPPIGCREGTCSDHRTLAVFTRLLAREPDWWLTVCAMERAGVAVRAEGHRITVDWPDR